MVAAGASPTLRRRMRILASALTALCCIVAVAGCGAEEAGGPLDEALRYLPADAPFAVAIDTDLEDDQYRSLDRIVKRFPFGEQAIGQLEESIEDDEGVDFERDVKPLL